MNRQEALSHSRRFEALRLAFPPPHRLLRTLGSVVVLQSLLAKKNEPARNANILLSCRYA
jgi:hypothetical protein